MPFFLGFDCGGSSTRCVVINERNEVVFEGHGGPANLSTTPHDDVAASLQQASIGCPTPDAAVGCFAGLLDAGARHAASRLLSTLLPGVAVDAYADYVAALAAAPDEADVVVIAGTGSVFCSWKEGRPFKTGGGGALLGDEGSAFDLARIRLRTMICGEPGSDPGPNLAAAMDQALGTAKIDLFVAALYRQSAPAPLVASLAPAVVRDALQGEVCSTAAMRRAMSSLGRGVFSHMRAKSAQGDLCRIVLAGGLWEIDPVLQTFFEESLHAETETDDEGFLRFGPISSPFRQYHGVRLQTAPAMGAARLARRLFYGNGI